MKEKYNNLSIATSGGWELGLSVINPCVMRKSSFVQAWDLNFGTLDKW